MKKLFNDPELDIYSLKFAQDKIMTGPSDFEDDDDPVEGGVELPAV